MTSFFSPFSSVLFLVNREKSAFSKISTLGTVLKTYVFGACKRRLRVDGWLKGRKKNPRFHKISAYVCTSPEDVAYLVQKSMLIGVLLPGSLLFP